MSTSKENELFVITQVLNAPIDLVWEALTDAQLLRQWCPYFPDFRPEVGFESRFLLGSDKDHQYLHIVHVTEVVEKKKLSYTWRYNGYAGNSLVTFELAKEGSGTKLVFTHEIIEPFPDDPAFAKENFAEGWKYTVQALRRYVEHGLFVA